MTSLADLHLTLDDAALSLVRRTLADRLREGAAADGREIAMIPAWLAPPRPGLAGEALAIDAGGTNLRAARVVAGAGGAAEVVAIHEEPFPGAAGRPEASAAELFAAHARVVEKLGAPPGLPIGYCFSYPSAVRSDGDAVLIRWTKEVRVPGVEGQRVGTMLSEHLRLHGLVPGPVFVLNDTIATLAAGNDPEGARSVGLIVGTGTNIGAYLPVSILAKLAAPGWPSPLMAVNFESGAFAPPGLGLADADVDAASHEPGKQRFEKAVSGAYVGRIFTAAAKHLGIAVAGGAADSAEVSRLAALEPGTPAGALARAVLDRSADLVAATLAATSDVIGGDGPLHVHAEGSMVAKGPGYLGRLRTTLARMLAEDGGRIASEVVLGNGGNLVGCALAALSHQQR
jgi:hexokinase